MQRKNLIKPLAIDCKTIGILESEEELRIHSIFKNTINIKTNHGLIVVTTIKEVIPPLGIIIDSKDFEDFKDLNFKLNVSKSMIYNSDCLKYSILPDTRVLSIYFRRFKELDLRNGFGISIDAMHSILKRKFYPATLNEDEKLINKIIVEKDINQLMKLIGRGQGLTPSGDDFFVGFLAALMSNHRIDLKELKEHPEIQNINKYTTDIGVDYIVKAINGKFSQNILRLINFIQLNIYDEKAMLDLINFGDTSGVDTFLGILAGYVSLITNTNNYIEEKIV